MVYLLKMGGFSMAMLNSQMVYGLWNIYNSMPMDPSTFLGSVWGMLWGVKYLLRKCLDP